ncbi:PREDICTED: uncharacterized protein LOC107186832 [Dufourea novaeangliae]|uniref:uncharacterized protein LOC107186832 n=1 Tax=Dufourea novaeangliae TaxID=178035 RepID=UPI0007670965|nr:PREDICTED: uncharacterized protein LOC107186832 [Dufourea novaeangliae]
MWNVKSHFLASYSSYSGLLLVLQLINHVLTFKKITMKEQKILTHMLVSIERLVKNQIFYQEVYGDQSIAFVMELLFRCLYQKDTEIQVDQRLLLALGSYIWECIVWCSKNLEKFIESGAIYVILDIIEVVPYTSQRLYLTILTDMCENYFCGAYLCTWRRINKKTGLMSLLATIWREEEIRLQVKRCSDDEEFPEMSRKQWLETYDRKLCGHISPAINDMVGSVRSKIYSIRKIIERDNERFEMAKQHYKIMYHDLPMEDRITISITDLYFKLKLGQVWVEVGRYFEQVGTTPLGMDGQAIFLMTQRYNSWGRLLKEVQKMIIQSIKREKEIQEKDEYARIKDSKLILSLNAFDELEYIYRTTNRAYMIKKKNEQILQVNAVLNSASDNNYEQQFHRTFMDKVCFTTIFDQHIMINNLTSDENFGQPKVLPVSPCQSHIFDETSFSEMSCLSLTSDNFSRLEEFDEEILK